MGKRSRQQRRHRFLQQGGPATDWLAVQFTEHIKPHYVVRAWLPQLQRDLQQRYQATLTKQQVVTTGGVDLPGMICADRQFVHVPLDEHFTLAVPVTDVSAFVRELEQVVAREFADGTAYYKLHGYTHAVLLSPTQREALEHGLRELVSGAERQAACEDDRLVAAIEAAAHAGLNAPGRVVEAARRRQRLKLPE